MVKMIFLVDKALCFARIGSRCWMIDVLDAALASKYIFFNPLLAVVVLSHS